MAQESSLNDIAQEGADMASHHVAEQKVWDFFVDLFDGNEYASAGACGNMQHESGLYTDNAENAWNSMTGHSDEWLTERINNNLTGESPSISLSTFLQRSWWVNSIGFGYGLSQWTGSGRRTMLWNRTIDEGLPIDDEDAQLEYIRWEFTEGSYKSVRTAMINATSVEEATRIYCNRYEVGAWSQDRLTQANRFYDTYSGSSGDYYHLYINVTGNGTATVSPSRVEVGDYYTLTCTPASGETLLDIIARETATGMVVAIPVVTGAQTIEMRSSSDIVFDISFSGTPPVPPVPPAKRKKKGMPIWEYPRFKRR
jgi:hypothetical protein